MDYYKKSQKVLEREKEEKITGKHGNEGKEKEIKERPKEENGVKFDFAPEGKKQTNKRRYSQNRPG